MSFTLCTLPDAIAEAGEGANWDYPASGAFMISWSDQIEGELCLLTQYDWVTNVANLHPTTSGALTQLAAVGIAMKALSFDKSGYVGGEYNTKMSMLYDRYVQGITRINDKDGKDFMLTGSIT